MFQQKIDDIFKDLSNVSGITDEILVVCYDSDGKAHDKHYKKYYKYASRPT